MTIEHGVDKRGTSKDGSVILVETEARTRQEGTIVAAMDVDWEGVKNDVVP